MDEDYEPETYAGWTIRYGFLDGNLGDGEAAAHAEAFAEAVEFALEQAFPGATIEVPYQCNCSGSLPATLKLAAWNQDGDEGDMEGEINQIADSVFENGAWALGEVE